MAESLLISSPEKGTGSVYSRCLYPFPERLRVLTVPIPFSGEALISSTWWKQVADAADQEELGPPGLVGALHPRLRSAVGLTPRRASPPAGGLCRHLERTPARSPCWSGQE